MPAKEESADKQRHLFDQMMMMAMMIVMVIVMMIIVIVMMIVMVMMIVLLVVAVMMMTVIRKERKHLHCLFPGRTIQCILKIYKKNIPMSDNILEKIYI